MACQERVETKGDGQHLEEAKPDGGKEGEGAGGVPAPKGDEEEGECAFELKGGEETEA